MFTQEEKEFLNQILGTVEVNGMRVPLQGLVQVLQKLNAPDPGDIPVAEPVAPVVPEDIDMV